MQTNSYERAMEVADQILGLSCELRKLVLMHQREMAANSNRRTLTLIDGGNADSAQSNEGVSKSVGVGGGQD